MVTWVWKEYVNETRHRKLTYDESRVTPHLIVVHILILNVIFIIVHVLSVTFLVLPKAMIFPPSRLQNKMNIIQLYHSFCLVNSTLTNENHF